MWKNFIRDYFTFTRKERNGLIVLLILIFLVIAWPKVAWWIRLKNPPDFSAYQKEIDSFQKRLDAEEMASAHSYFDSSSLAQLEISVYKSSIPASDIVPFPFDPNTVSLDDWLRLGINQRVAKTILNFRSKGGKFSSKEDLKKIYGFKEEDYDRLEDYIIISHDKTSVSKSITALAENKTESKRIVELNTADSLTLTTVRGIGPVLASRIIKFRNKLGGFYSVEQLKDVYGISQDGYADIKQQLVVDTIRVKKIQINSVSLEELKQHPYFRNPIATTLIRYRDEHGSFKSIDDLRNIDMLSEESLAKIHSYLEF